MNVAIRFIESARKYPKHIALEVGKDKLTYDQLFGLAIKVANCIKTSSQKKFIGILSYRSLSAYVGVLGTLLSDKAYMPVSPKFPLERIVKLLKNADCDTIIIDKNFQQHLSFLLREFEYKLTFITCEYVEVDNDVKQYLSVFLAGSFLEKDNTEFRLEENSNDNAYLLYTSGSTGEPKGIVVSHENLNAFFNNVLPKYDITTSDRISQFFDFTFDPSIHDMFLAWNSGAVLVCVPDEHLIAPHKFIIQNDITFWSSVPSVGRFLRKLRVLKSGVFPQLRYTLFTGEALPFEVYSSWKEAASNSVIINGYGPTELTMNISDFWIPDDLSLNDCYNGIVPIGFVFSDHIFVLMENDMISTDKGELLISGPQQVNGYFNDPDRTKESFIYINNRRYYKTGDIVLSNIDGLKYLGRLDNQVQIRGFRVELSEIEYALKIMRISESVAIGYPRNTNIVERIVLFVANYGGTVSEIVSFLKDRLPEYMIPTNIVLVDSFPLTVNGKLDKNELYNRINDGKH